MPIREYAPLCLAGTPAGEGSSRLGVDRRPCVSTMQCLARTRKSGTQADQSSPARRVADRSGDTSSVKVTIR
jgi:hypothetical protein